MKLLSRQKALTVTKIVFSKITTKNLISQAKYIFDKTKSIEITDRYIDKMQTFIKEILSNFPKSGRPSQEIAAETRKLVYQGYSIIYKIGSKKYRISYYL